MLKKLSDKVYRISSSWLALLSLVIMLSFMALVMPGESAKAAAYSAGFGTPDTTGVYSAEELLRMAESYGIQGRQAYIHARFTFDLAFPLVYAFFLSICTSWILARLLSPGTPWRLLNLLPLGAMLFDLLENVCTSIVMAAYPAVPLAAAYLAAIFTPIKWGFVASSFGLLTLAGLTLAWRGIFKRSNP